MKILSINWYYPPSIGGGEISSHSINLGLKQRNHEITVMTQGKDNEKIAYEGIKIIRTPLLIQYKEDNPDEFRRYLLQKFKEINPDIIHCQNFTLALGPKRTRILVNTAKSLNIPIIEHARHAMYHSPEIVTPLLKLGWDKIISVSEFAKQRIIDIGKVNPQNIISINNFVDEDQFNPSNKIQKNLIKNRSKKIILFPSRIFTTSQLMLDHFKQFKEVIEACKLLKERYKMDEFLLFCLGIPKIYSSEQRNKANHILNEMIKKAGLTEQSYRTPYLIDHSLMPSIYKQADIICAPHLNESFCRVHVEAMMMGKRIIGAKSGATELIINKKFLGELTEPHNPDSIAKAILKLINEDNNESEKIRDHAVRNYGKQKFFEKLTSLYEAIMRQPGLEPG